MFPNVLAVAILRQPVDRAYSHYWLSRSRGRESRSWAEVVSNEVEANDHRGLLWPSRYAIHLETLFATFGQERCLILSFDQLSEAPTRLFDSLCRFIGVAEAPPPSVGQRVNPYFAIRSQSIRRLTKANRIPRRLRNAIAKLNHVEKRYPPMSRELRERLDVFFAEDCAAMDRALTRKSKDAASREQL